MSLKERLAIYEKIEEHRGHALLVYVTSKRDGRGRFDGHGCTALPYRPT